VQIRPAAPADAPALGRLHVRAWQSAYRGMLPDDYLDALDAQAEPRERMWRDLIERPRDGQTLLVAEDGRAVVGFCHTARAREGPPDLGELFSIYVDPDRIGTGLGAALMRPSLDAMRAAGFPAAVLWVLDANDLARRFYERFGWRPDGTVKEETLWGVTVREVRYRIELGGAGSESSRKTG